MPNTDPNAFYAGGLAVESYDLFVEANPLFAHDCAFYVEVARSRPGRVLELGCGTGRVLAALARAGVPATGVDLSAAMLTAAAARLRTIPGADVRLQAADMRAFDLAETFEAVLITCRAFHHVTDPEGQRATLEAARRRLPAGGLLVLDLFDPLLLLAGDPAPPSPPPREVTDPATGVRYRRSVVARENDPFRQLVSERLRIEAFDAAGARLGVEESSWSLRWLMRQEVAWLLALCGFEPVACYSDFQRAPPAYGREQLWVARAV